MLIKSENNSYYLSCNNSLFEISKGNLLELIKDIDEVEFEKKKAPFFKLPYLCSRSLEMILMRLPTHRLAHIFKYYEDKPEVYEYLFTGISKAMKKLVLEDMKSITEIEISYLYDVEKDIRINEEKGEIVIFVDEESMNNKITEFEELLKQISFHEFMMVIFTSPFFTSHFRSVVRKLDLYREVAFDFFNGKTSEIVVEDSYSINWMSIYENLINFCELLHNYIPNRHKKAIYLYGDYYYINCETKLIVDEHEIRKIRTDYENLNRRRDMYLSQDLYQKAILFAGEKHKSQTLPNSDISYVVHLSNVGMEIILAWSKYKDFDINGAVQIALLHDTLEDSDTSYDELVENFGSDVANGVSALTKDKNLSKEEQMSDSLLRINFSGTQAGIVKLADRITNLQAPPKHWSQAKIKTYWEEARLIHEELASRNTYLGKRLADKIDEYKKYFEYSERK